AFVTGEIKHNYILEAYDIDLTVVDAGHYKTEDVVIDYLVKQLSAEFPNVIFTKSCVFTDHINFV
ncbi:MAG: Nif3-like dinuclear metal center hexameric protein, partial [Acutalibacteraceae bacterium]|nr:Nif3-like dinuclear metal center hexameric protein [Acutalibacteraceae bacterium]